MIRTVMALLLLVVILPQHIVLAQDNQEERYKVIIHQIIDSTYNHGDFENIDDVFATDFLAYPGEMNWVDWRNSVATLRAAMPDLQATIELLIAEDNRVAIRLNLLGTFVNQMIFPNQEPIPPSHQKVEFAVNRVFYFNESGQIIEAWDGFDNLNFLTQIEIMPETGFPPEKLGVVEIIPTILETHNKEIVIAYFEAINRGTLLEQSDNFSDDYIAHPPFGQFDFSGQKDDFEAMRNAMPDLTFNIEQVVVEGNWVGVVSTLQGTFTNNYVLSDGSTIPATDNAIELLDVIYFHFDEQGVILESWELYDSWSFLIQLGLLSDGS